MHGEPLGRVRMMSRHRRPGDGPSRDRFDPFALESLPGFGEQLAVLLELRQQLLAARVFTDQVGKGAAPFQLQFIDSLPEHLFRPGDVDGWYARAVTRQRLDRFEPAEDAAAQLLEVVDQPRRQGLQSQLRRSLLFARFHGSVVLAGVIHVHLGPVRVQSRDSLAVSRLRLRVSASWQ